MAHEVFTVAKSQMNTDAHRHRQLQDRPPLGGQNCFTDIKVAIRLYSQLLHTISVIFSAGNVLSIDYNND